jgi:hypothetical protein
VDRVGERIDEVVADLERGQEHEAGERRAQWRGRPQRFNEADRQQRAEQPREERGEAAVLRRQRCVAQPLHGALGIADVHQDRFQAVPLHRIDPALALRAGEPQAIAFEQAIGRVAAREFRDRVRPQHAVGAFGRVLPAQLVAQHVDIGDVAAHDLVAKGLSLNMIGQGRTDCARQAARGVGHRAPHDAPFPPARIGGIDPEPEQEREAGAEDGERQRGAGKGVK